MSKTFTPKGKGKKKCCIKMVINSGCQEFTYKSGMQTSPLTFMTGFCSIFRRWSHDYGKSGTYSKVCETLVHIPVDFVSTQLKWTFIWVWQNQLVYVPRFHILWYVPLSPKFLAENNFLPTYNSWTCRNWGLQPSTGETRAFFYGHKKKFKAFFLPIMVLNTYCCWFVNHPKLNYFKLF